MADINPRPTDSSTSDPMVEDDAPGASRIPLVVWLVVSAGFLGYLIFGSFEARIWNFGRLFFQDRKITHVWAYFGDRLPDMPASPLFPALYYLSLVVMVAGTLLGLWCFLMGDEPPDPTKSTIHRTTDNPPVPTQAHDS